MRSALIAFLIVVCLPFVLLADVFVPSSDVTSRVIVRQTASAQSAWVGSLELGEQAELLGSVPNWYRLQLANGFVGFVPKRWAQVISVGPPQPPHQCELSQSTLWMWGRGP